MNKNVVITGAIAIIFLVIGYILGNFLPFRNVSQSTTGTSGTLLSNIPSGKGVLSVIVKDTDNKPMIGIEVDVNLQPGQPESWGTKEADISGITNFELNPGDYYVYFNTSRFPQGYVVPAPQKVTVKEGAVEEANITLQKS